MESEFVGVSQNDDCRMAAVLSATALEHHPLSTFMWGNKKSLWTEPLEKGIPIRERIMQHWTSFYSASCMNLVVMGGESLDVLEEYVTEDFGSVRNKLTASSCVCLGPHHLGWHTSAVPSTWHVSGTTCSASMAFCD